MGDKVEIISVEYLYPHGDPLWQFDLRITKSDGAVEIKRMFAKPSDLERIMGQAKIKAIAKANMEPKKEEKVEPEYWWMKY